MNATYRISKFSIASFVVLFFSFLAFFSFFFELSPFTFHYIDDISFSQIVDCRNSSKTLEIELNLSLDLILWIFKFTLTVMPKITSYLISAENKEMQKKERKIEKIRCTYSHTLFSHCSIILVYPESFFMKIPAINVKEIKYYPEERTKHSLQSFLWLFAQLRKLA